MSESGDVEDPHPSSDTSLLSVIDQLRRSDRAEVVEWLRGTLAAGLGTLVSRDVTPASLVEAVFEEASAEVRDVLATAALSLLDSVASGDAGTQSWGAELLLLVNPMLLGSRCRHEAAAALVAIANARNAEENLAELRRFALQGLIELQAPLPRDFWVKHYEIAPSVNGLVAFVGLSRLDLTEALLWLGRWPDPQAAVDALEDVLPLLIDEHPREDVIAATWGAVPQFQGSHRSQVETILDEADLRSTDGRRKRTVAEYEDLIEQVLRHFPDGIEEGRELLVHLERVGLNEEPRKRNLALDQVLARWQPDAVPPSYSLRLLQILTEYPSAKGFMAVAHHLKRLWMDIEHPHIAMDPRVERIAQTTFAYLVDAAITIPRRIPGFGRKRTGPLRQAWREMVNVALTTLRSGHIKWRDDLAGTLGLQLSADEMAEVIVDLLRADLATEGEALQSIQVSFSRPNAAKIYERLAHRLVAAFREAKRPMERAELQRAVITLNQRDHRAFQGIRPKDLEVILGSQVPAQQIMSELASFAARDLADEDDG